MKLRGLGWFYNMKTIQRLWFFYTVFFLLPLIVWTVFYFFQLHENIMNKYRSYHKDIAISMAASYQDRILSIVNTAALFQQNRYFINYVEDWNQPMAERIFSFNIDINPLIGYIVTTNNLLQDLAVYSYRSARIPPYFFIRDWDKQFLPPDKIIALGLHEAAWQFTISDDGTTRLICYVSVFNNAYSSKIASVLLFVDTSELLDQFQTENQDLKVMLQKDGKMYTLSPQGLIPAGKQEMAGLETLLKSPNGVYQTGLSSINLTDKLFLPELDAEIYFIASLPYITGDDIPALFIPFLLLLLLLTSILFINFAAGTRRISRLTRHFQASNSGNLEPLEQDNYHDEIGFLYECYNRMAGNINHLVNDVYKAELKSRDARYYALQSQINPHFLLNSLENIRMTAMMHGDNETSGMIYKLAKMMNYTIRQSNLVSTLAQEVDHCRNYLEFCVIRRGSGFNYTIACPDELAEQACPKFILQPIVENSIEHAFDSRAQKKKVSIAISSVDEKIQVEVADNGRGMDAESLEALRLLLKNGLEDNGAKAEYSPEEGHGIGLLNVHERLKIFFGSSCGIEIESSDQGTIVRLLLDPHPDSAFAADKHAKTQIY